MPEVILSVGWGRTADGDLARGAMVRNRVFAERLGMLKDAVSELVSLPPL